MFARLLLVAVVSMGLRVRRAADSFPSAKYPTLPALILGHGFSDLQVSQNSHTWRAPGGSYVEPQLLEALKNGKALEGLESVFRFNDINGIISCNPSTEEYSFRGLGCSIELQVIGQRDEPSYRKGVNEKLAGCKETGGTTKTCSLFRKVRSAKELFDAFTTVAENLRQ